MRKEKEESLSFGEKMKDTYKENHEQFFDTLREMIQKLTTLKILKANGEYLYQKKKIMENI